MNPRLRMALIIGAVAVAGYLGYRWWTNRQSGSGLGANLNSVAPELIAGSSGPQSGLNYYAGSTTVNLTEPVTQPNPRPHPVPIIIGGGTVPSFPGGPGQGG